MRPQIRLLCVPAPPYPEREFAKEELSSPDMVGTWVKLDNIDPEQARSLQTCYERECRGWSHRKNGSLLLEYSTKRLNQLVQQKESLFPALVHLRQWLHNMSNSPSPWCFKENTLRFEAGRPQILGVVNVTPDSFSDGGQFSGTSQAIEHALKLIEEGADIIDIGGESTRPGAQLISAEEECARVLPVVQGLASQTHVPISIDTSKAKVAQAALQAGATIVNDISCMRFDPDLPQVVAEHKAYVIMMHSRHTPASMQRAPSYQNLWDEILEEVNLGLSKLAAAGVEPARIAIDPGIGFGKRLQDNYRILRELPVLYGLGMPVLVGASRKSFLGAILHRPANERLEGSLAAAATAALQGAHLLRVHDVAETKRLLDIMQAILWPPFAP